MPAPRLAHHRSRRPTLLASPARPSRTAAIRSTPSLSTTTASTRSPTTGRSSPVTDVVPSTSGPWWAARPAACPAMARSPSRSSTSTCTLLTDAVGGPLIADLVDQGADHLVAIVDLVGIDLARQVRRLRCPPRREYAEDADHVQPGLAEEVREYLRRPRRGLAGEADDEVAADAGRQERASRTRAISSRNCSRVAESAHPAQHRRRGVLEGQVEVGHHLRHRGDGLQHVRA